MSALHRFCCLTVFAACVACVTGRSGAQPVPDQRTAEEILRAEFVQPPDAARPWVYWFWLNGNITPEGIAADLAAMHRVGIGGALIMEVDQGAPVGPVDFMSASWRDMFQHVQREAQRWGLQINMNNDAGWNGSGGPWIQPAQAMQKVVWSETDVDGPADFAGTLPQPEKVADFYRDICVLAVPQTGDYRIDRIRAKAMYEVGGVGAIAREVIPAEHCIDRQKVVTLTERMNEDGRLEWSVPAGAWTILRFGHTCTGVENAPAPASGRGLECDKLSKEGIEAHFAGMMEKLAADTRIGPAIGTTGLVATHIDSWENGSQNWTGAMREEFQRRRGYDLLPYLPVMTGRVVDTLELSERFLWDLRQTVSELVLENYAGRFQQLAHAHGMRFTVEAYGCPCDALPFAGQSDEPMGEFWTPSGAAIETCKTMASAGHVYGQTIIGAEAFTSGDQEKWREHPATLKALGDRVFCAGINRFVFHRYALQPWTEQRAPGMTMGPWGQHYERTQTWWEWSAAWHQYLARCQYLLRQGLYAADICYVQAEAPPQGPRDYPHRGYGWDECPPEVVLTRMTVRDHRIALPDGMTYRLLVLPDSQTITPRLLRKVKELVAAGATVIGPRPVMSPSLADYPDGDAEVVSLAAELWGHPDGQDAQHHVYGQGRVLWGIAPEDALQADGVPPDFASGHALHYIHRTAGERELYFVANPHPYELTATCSFRVRGKTPAFWWPDSGRIEPAAVYQEDGAVTHVALPLPATGSVFVVFQDRQDGPDPVVPDPVVEVQRDGKLLVAAAPVPPIAVSVVQARYGVLDDPSRTRDVTRKVQDIVDQGTYSFPVSSLAAHDDPAEGTVKTLNVEYSIDGKQFTVRATDRMTVHLTDNAVPVQIEQADYGVPGDPQRTRDVRDKLQRLVDAGERSFVVARMAEGDDPAFMVVKTLHVEFTINGQQGRVSGTDPEIIHLVPASVMQPPAAVVRTDARGPAFLEVREPGDYICRSAAGRKVELSVKQVTPPTPLPGPWQVHFAPEWGGPGAVTFDQLGSWSDHADPGVRYYSGAATYTNTLTLPDELRTTGDRLVLDLGSVQVMARVTLNGTDLGTLWKPPFRLDITDVARTGENDLAIEVVNLWPNRLIGDEQLPEDSERNPNGTLKAWPQWLIEGKPSPTGRLTFTSWRLWNKDDSLLPSGLLGPVTLCRVPRIPIAIP